MATFAPPPAAMVAATRPSYHRLPLLSTSTSSAPPHISLPLRHLSPLVRHSSSVAARPRHFRIRAVLEEAEEVKTSSAEEEEGGGEEAEEVKTSSADEEEGGGEEANKLQMSAPCELYVCNLPRSCGASELLDLFKPFGTVVSVEVCTNNDTGKSKGCGFVSMSSILEAKAAMISLDGSDCEGREMRVKYSADMVPQRNNIGTRKPNTKRRVLESPYKLYVGNLSWSVTPDHLRERFCEFGTIISTRVLHDRKEGKNRVYAFLTFSTPEELQSALSSNETKFLGRRMMVRKVEEKN